MKNALLVFFRHRQGIFAIFMFWLFLFRVADGDKLCAVHEGVLEADGTVVRARHDACTAVVALAGVEHDGVLAFFGRGDEDIHLTDVDAGVAADAFCFIVKNRVCAGTARVLP